MDTSGHCVCRHYLRVNVDYVGAGLPSAKARLTREAALSLILSKCCMNILSEAVCVDPFAVQLQPLPGLAFAMLCGLIGPVHV